MRYSSVSKEFRDTCGGINKEKASKSQVESLAERVSRLLELGFTEIHLNRRIRREIQQLLAKGDDRLLMDVHDRILDSKPWLCEGYLDYVDNAAEMIDVVSADGHRSVGGLVAIPVIIPINPDKPILRPTLNRATVSALTDQLREFQVVSEDVNFILSSRWFEANEISGSWSHLYGLVNNFAKHAGKNFSSANREIAEKELLALHGLVLRYLLCFVCSSDVKPMLSFLMNPEDGAHWCHQVERILASNLKTDVSLLPPLPLRVAFEEGASFLAGTELLTVASQLLEDYGAPTVIVHQYGDEDEVVEAIHINFFDSQGRLLNCVGLDDSNHAVEFPSNDEIMEILRYAGIKECIFSLELKSMDELFEHECSVEEEMPDILSMPTFGVLPRKLH